jgi:hypothetical protein
MEHASNAFLHKHLTTILENVKLQFKDTDVYIKIKYQTQIIVNAFASQIFKNSILVVFQFVEKTVKEIQ